MYSVLGGAAAGGRHSSGMKLYFFVSGFIFPDLDIELISHQAT